MSIAIAIYLCCLVIAGYGVCAWLSRGASRLERFGMSACAGPGVMGLALIAWSMMGHVPTRSAIAVITIICGVSAIIALRKAPKAPPIAKPKLTQSARLWMLFCGIVIATAIFTTIWSAFVAPTFEWDAFAIWQLKAKVLTLQPMTPRPAYFSDLTLSYSHLRYPLLVPMASAGLHAITGDFRDESGQAAFLISYLGLGAVVYAGVRARRNALAAASATALLLTIPWLMRFATAGTAEMALEAFYGASLVGILNWQQSRKMGPLILTALFSLFMLWTKNEGIALAAINFIVILALTPGIWTRRNILAALGFLIGVGALFVPWLIWSHGLPRTDEDYAGHLSDREIFSHLDRIPTILFQTLKETEYSGHDNIPGTWGISDHWGIFWPILFLVTLISWRKLRLRPIATLWICLILHAMAYMLAYIITPLDVKNLMEHSADRLVLHLTPAAALIIGLLWPEF